MGLISKFGDTVKYVYFIPTFSESVSVYVFDGYANASRAPHLTQSVVDTYWYYKIASVKP